MRFDSSALSDFSGSLVVDDQSNQFVILKLKGAKGTLYGTVGKKILLVIELVKQIKYMSCI